MNTNKINDNLEKAYLNALQNFGNAVVRKNNLAAARFREELHTVVDMQLDVVMKELRKENN